MNCISNSKTYASMVILMQLIVGSLCLLSAAFTRDNKKEKSYVIVLSYAITSVLSFNRVGNNGRWSVITSEKLNKI